MGMTLEVSTVIGITLLLSIVNGIIGEIGGLFHCFILFILPVLGLTLIGPLALDIYLRSLRIFRAAKVLGNRVMLLLFTHCFSPLSMCPLYRREITVSTLN